MLIRSQTGALIIRAHNVALDHYAQTDKYALLAADGLDPEGVIVGIYATRQEAEDALDYILEQAAKDKPADLRRPYQCSVAPSCKECKYPCEWPAFRT